MVLPQHPRRRRARLVVPAVVLLAAGAVAVALALGPDGGSSGAGPRPTAAGPTVSSTPAAGTTATGIPEPRLLPKGLGQDPVLDALARNCHVGDMPACDHLYDAADAGSDYETYGDTCAGRQPSGTFAMCADTFSGG